MDTGTKKKLTGAGIAALAVIIFGENQIMEMDERLQALEVLHPELAQEELDAIAEELQTEGENEEPVVEEGDDPEIEGETETEEE